MTSAASGNAAPGGSPDLPDAPAPGTWQRDGEAAMPAALAPVRAALLRHAREQADEIIGEARRQAEGALARARRDAAGRVAAAREAGRSQAAPLAAALRGESRRGARATVLSAQREAYEELRDRVGASVAGIRDEPGYELLLERLRWHACRVVGPGAKASEVPAGGVIARGPGIVVDCSLPRLADATMEALGDQVAWLWTPATRPGRS
ncbi:MAG TPA: V-type ATP synthase subunit E family protein [Streptosporangiaceae bacterium]|nr:V-type ATP synthase subunit E family protein [Streptosporangiaceae bacterium]